MQKLIAALSLLWKKLQQLSTVSCRCNEKIDKNPNYRNVDRTMKLLANSSRALRLMGHSWHTIRKHFDDEKTHIADPGILLHQIQTNSITNRTQLNIWNQWLKTRVFCRSLYFSVCKLRMLELYYNLFRTIFDTILKLKELKKLPKFSPPRFGWPKFHWLSWIPKKTQYEKLQFNDRDDSFAADETAKNFSRICLEKNEKPHKSELDLCKEEIQMFVSTVFF